MAHEGHDGRDAANHDHDARRRPHDEDRRRSPSQPTGGDHRHDHDDPHEPADPHDHRHDDDPPCDPGPALGPGAGAGKVLFLDAPSGLAGDMIVAALVDLGVPRRVVEDALERLPLAGYHVHFGRRERSGIVATSFDVHVDGPQPARPYAVIRRMLDEARLAPSIKARAHKTFERLAAAEARVHKVPLEAVHLHEVGGVDAIVDVVGSAAALDHLGSTLLVSPLPMGRGWTRAAHGVLPLPAPATVECLTGLFTYDGGLDFEFVTPTGAAIVGAHAAGSCRWPALSPERTGWGAGTAEVPDRPNVLRALLGAPSPAIAPGVTGATHAVLEANVDDATGELAGSWIEALLAAGAVDAWATPITMKKGRPAWTLAALAPLEAADRVAQAVLRETTSLGVRRTDVARTERPRTMAVVETIYGSIPVKVAEGPFGPPLAKPEFDACLRAARTHQVPVREVVRLATLAAGSLLGG